MKVLKHKNLMGLIFTALLSLPLLGIGVRCGYVIANKNAYQNYSGNTGQTIEYTETTKLIEGNTYSLTLDANSIINFTTSGTLKVSILDGNGNFTFFNTFMANNQPNIKRFLINNENTQPYIQFLDANNNALNDFDFAGNRPEREMVINFVIEENYTLNINQLYEKRIYEDAYLDNVFEYSVSQFTSENNLGNVNLFSWFTNMFLSDNAHNNLYVGFANWYMNYAMLVACMHLLFLVLMWFINFARRLLERGMNYDF